MYLLTMKQLSKAAPHAKSGEPILVAGLYGGTAGAANNAPNQGAWTAAEDQIIFDSTLRGDGWAGLSPLLTIHGRSADQVNGRIQALTSATGPLPAWWTHTHQEAQVAQRKKAHSGEKELKVEEQEGLARWVYNGYQGIRPAVFHHSRCTERLRKEVRAMEDMDTECLMLAGQIFDARLRQ